jgi:hypothetical protein
MGKKKIRKPLDDVDTSGSTGTVGVSSLGRVALRKEQWECSEKEHRERKKRTTCRKTLKARPQERKER